MGLTNSGPHRHQLVPAALFVLALAMAAFGIAGLAGGAKADGPVTLKFDNGRVGIGVLLDDEKVLPAADKFPSPDLPLPQPHTDIQLTGTETNGKLSFPAVINTGVQFPYMYVISPTDPTLKVPFTFRLGDSGLTGTYDDATGETHLRGKMDIVVVTGLGATPNLLSPVDTGVPPIGLFGRCRAANVPVDFSTETKAPFTAQRFTGGFGVNGALTTTWKDLPKAVAENSTAEQKSLCSDQLDKIIHTPGGIWLSNGIAAPKPQPVVPPTCADDLRLCPVPTYVEISKVKVRPKKRFVKAGKKIKIRVRVTNSGTRDSTATKVRLRSSNRRVRVRKKPLKLNIPAGSAVTRKVTVRVLGKAKGRARVTAATHGLRSGTTLKVKQRKRHGKHHRKHHEKKHHRKK